MPVKVMYSESFTKVPQVRGRWGFSLALGDFGLRRSKEVLSQLLFKFPYDMARWSVVTLDPGKRQMNNPFYYSLTRRSREQVLPTRARNNDTWDRRPIVKNMR